MAYDKKNHSGNKGRVNSDKGTWTVNDTEHFINPYTFIPPQKVNKTDCTNSEGSLTGYLKCSIHLKTPLIIPDSSLRKDTGAEHYSYPFFRIDGKPVISGSEVRGMIRSVYETVTDSCFSTAAETEISMRTHDFNAKPGILQKSDNSYILYEADTVCIDSGINPSGKGAKFPKPDGLNVFTIAENGNLKSLKSDKEWENFGKITVNWFGNKLRKWAGKNDDQKKYPANKDGSTKTGYLLLVPWNKNGSKRYDHVMIFKDSKEKIAEFSVNDVTSRLEKQLNDYIENGGNKVRFLDMRAKIRKKPEFIPIWYRDENEKVYLSFSQQGRKEFRNTMLEMLEPFNARPCTCREKMCPACSLFGYTSRSSGAVSRIRISDAVSVEECSFTTRTLAELSSPKISSVEFYLSAESEMTWWDYDNPRSFLRGRKFYWHHKLNSSSETRDKNNRNATHETCESGTFDFKLYFDRVTQEELDVLKWILCLGENDSEGKYQHKLGHGKPLGFGSVKITVNKEVIRELSNNYKLKVTDNPVIPDISEQMSASALLTVCNAERFSPLEQELIRYPTGEDKTEIKSENSSASHQWFLGNRSKDGNAGLKEPHINYRLPVYNAENQTLPKWEKQFKKNSELME